MSLARRSRQDFDSGVLARGEQYFRDGRVEIEVMGTDFLEAEVAGQDIYRVILDWSNIRELALLVDCTCPYFEDVGNCKHIWATILQADAQGIGSRIPGTSPLDVVDRDRTDDHYGSDDDEWDDDEWDDDEWDDDELGGAILGEFFERLAEIRGEPRLGRSNGRAQPLSWRQQLAVAIEGSRAMVAEATIPTPRTAKLREPWFVLDVASTLQTGQITLCLYQRETKQNGEFGKIKKLSIASGDIRNFSSAEDRELLELILASGSADRYDSYRSPYAYRPKVAYVQLATAAYPYVLPRLCATGRFLWMDDVVRGEPGRNGRPIAWDDGPPWRFRMRVEADDENQQWLLRGELLREGQPDPLPLAQPALISAAGIMLLDDRLVRYEGTDCFAWIATLGSHPTIAIPYADRWEMLQRWWEAPALPPVDAPDGFLPEQVSLPPQGRLEVHAPASHRADRLYGNVEFVYGDRKVELREPSAGVVDAEEQRVVLRDLPKEQELFASLLAAGARTAGGYEAQRHDVWILRKDLPTAVDALVGAGWDVEAEGALIRKAGQYRLSVTSGVDWFDLEGECDFDGVSASLPALLQALRQGERYVRLGDGSRGLLPEAWLAKFGTLAELGESNGEHVRFRPSQAMLLDALLASQPEVSVDETFAQLRKKLRTFDGISPRDEPRGFRGELRNYQKEGLGWLHFLRDFRFGGCLADDMGLGKTIQVLAMLQARRMRPKDENGRRSPSLVVVPRSLVFNWIDEAERFTPNLQVLNYTGQQRKEMLDRIDDSDLVVTTYGTLRRDIIELKDIRFDYAILDESQAIKNAQSQNAKACRLIQADHRLAMTGTPVENHLGELWSLFEFLNPGMLGSSAAFQRASKNVQEQSDDLALFRQALKPFMLRRTKQKVLSELPEKTEQTLYCNLEGKQRKRYDEIRDFYRASLSEKIAAKGMAKSKIHVLEALLRLRQAACHPGLVDKNRKKESSAKLETLLEQLAEVVAEGHKALVFSQFTSLLAIVRDRLDAEKVVYEYLDGRTRKRKDRVRRFQEDPDCPVFLISLKAGGHGLNLTAADYVFILDPWWNPAVESQAIDRAHRIGQQQHVFAYRLIARDTVEEKILELQKSKRDLADAIIAADGNMLRNLTADDLQMLLS